MKLEKSKNKKEILKWKSNNRFGDKIFLLGPLTEGLKNDRTFKDTWHRLADISEASSGFQKATFVCQSLIWEMTD